MEAERVVFIKAVLRKTGKLRMESGGPHKGYCSTPGRDIMIQGSGRGKRRDVTNAKTCR